MNRLKKEYEDLPKINKFLVWAVATCLAVLLLGLMFNLLAHLSIFLNDWDGDVNNFRSL